MLLTEPPPSPYDVHFRVFGIPVRISPVFWIVVLVLGINPRGGTRPAELVIWIAVVLVSILVHEMGHAAMQRRFGGRPWITLYALGGLASCDDCDRRPSSQVLISLAGPVAGFLLALAAVTVVLLSGHPFGWTWADEVDWGAAGIIEATVLPMLGGMWYWEPFASQSADDLLGSALAVNILWGLVNLLPIYPLDGGRVAREVCTLKNPRAGIVLSLRISIIAAIAMAIAAAVAWQSLFTTIMFGYLAYSSYMTLQAYESQRW
jgi:Zn-dependent protease